MEQPLSSPSPEQLRCWRLFIESSLALVDVLDTELKTPRASRSVGTTSSSTSKSHPTASP